MIQNFTRELQLRLDAIEQPVARVMELLRKMQEEDLGIRTKSNDVDLVTKADYESERILLEFIKNHFPEDGILAEESGASSGGNYTWVIDPVDGTVNYAHGLPLYAISIGIMYKNDPVAGLVALPALGDIYRSIKGNGAAKNHKTIKVTSTNSLKQALVVTGFPYDRHSVLDTLLIGVRETLFHCRGLRRTGSAALDLCWVAEGRFDIHFENSLNPWDSCGGGVILREAGGRITNYAGEEHNPFMKTIVATNGILHDDFLRIISPMTGKKAFPD
jgi:myo-inositol-1(or 4)-monophosphatase